MNTTEWLEYYTTHPKDFDSMIKLAEDTILEQAAEIARLTAFNESMQTDARKNTETINKLKDALVRISHTSVTLGSNQSAWDAWRLCATIAGEALK